MTEPYGAVYFIFKAGICLLNGMEMGDNILDAFIEDSRVGQAWLDKPRV